MIPEWGNSVLKFLYLTFCKHLFQTAAEWQVVFWITAIIYAIGVVFFFFAVSGDKQPWADGVTAEHKEDVPYSNDDKGEEKKPLLDENPAEENNGPSAGDGQQDGDGGKK